MTLHNYNDCKDKPRKHENGYTHMQSCRLIILSKRACNQAVSLSVATWSHTAI